MSDLTESVCMKMRVNIYSCLLAFVLGSGVSAEIIHKVFEENQLVILQCPQPEREVTWSREVNGRRAVILTNDGDNDKRYSDTLKRFSSLSDKSLTFNKAVVSDSGTYFCNGEAVELTVIPSGTSPRLQPTTAATTIPPPTPPRTTTTAAPVTTLPSTPQGDTDSSYLWQMSVRTVFGILYLIIMISIIVTTWREAEQIQRQKQTEHDVTS